MVLTMNSLTLSDRHCAPGNSRVPALSESDIAVLLGQLDAQWRLGEGSASLERRFEFAGFSKAAYLANLCAWLADREGHHPDISFGVGYCHVSLSTHDVGGLTENDFIWAARLEVLIR